MGSPETPPLQPSHATAPPKGREPQARLVVQLAFDFLITPPERFDAETTKAIATVGRFVEADRSYVFILSPDGKLMSNTHEWCNDGVEPMISILQDLPADTFPYLMNRLRTVAIVDVRVKDLPPDAPAEREILTAQGIQSLVLVRVLDRQDQMIGFVGFDAVRNERPWSVDDYYLLEALGAILSSAIDRQRTGRELAQAEEVYRALTESSPDGVYRTAADGQATFVNARLCEITGRKPEQLYADNWGSYVHPMDHKRVQRESQEALRRGGEFKSEYRVVRADGSTIWVLDQARPIAPNGSPDRGYIGTLTDISAMKAAQVELARSESRNRALVEALPDLMLRIGRDGTYYDCSRVGRSLLVADPAGFIGKKVAEMHPPATADFWMTSIAAALDSELLQVFEYELPVEGHFRDFEARIVRSGADEVTAIIRDITEKSQLLREIRANEAELRAVHSAIPDLMFVLDRRGIIVAYNAHRREELYVPPELVSGSNILAIMPAELGARMLNAIQEALTTNSITTMEYDLPFPTGTQHFEARLAPMNEDCVVAVVRSITERKLFETELVRQRTQLRRLASELTVSEERHRRELALQLHDSIGQELAIARLRLQRGAETQGTPEALEHYGAASRLLETSIKQVQALTFEMSPPALHELGLPHALRSYSRHMQKTHGIEIEYEESGDQANLTGDQKILMFRCARELMANVVKHAEATHILVSLAYEPDEVAVRVEDDGKGFDPHQYLTQSPIDELHFGLFSIRERIAAYGGRLEIKSGEGTVATVSIPLGAGSSTDNDSTRTNPS